MQKRASQQASSKQHCLPGHQSQRAYGASFWPAPGAGAGRGACLLGALLLAAPAVQAQTPPGAGSVLRESAPAGAPPVAAPLPAPALPASPAAPAPAPDGAAGVTFVLREVSFSGNSVFSAAVLAPLAARDIGRTLGFDDLGEIAARVTGYYQRAGYVLTQVVLPPQDVAAGQVRFSVIEGRLGQVRIERLADLSVPDSVVRATLAGLVPGQPLKGPDLERAMLLLSDLPGLAPQSSLESGNDPGTFDLIVELKPAPRLQVSVDADNYGSRATRQYRAGAFARVNSPFGVGDNLDLRLLGSAGKGLKFGRIGYEAPLGYRGWRAGVSYAYLEYELGKELAALDASGRAGVFEAALSYPVLRARTTNLFARLSVERKALFDQIGVVAQSSHKTVRNVGVGLVYEGRDARALGGYTHAGLTAYFGKLAIGSAAALALDQGPGGLDTHGRYTRLLYQASRLQALSARSSVLVALAGQWASHNLDSAEKIAAGGPRAVRAYATSAGLGDEVHVLNLEYRWSVRPEAAVSLFHDTGWVRAVHRHPAPGGENRRTLRGYGLGLFWNVTPGLTLRASLAWRAGQGEPGADQRNPRLYAQAVHTF